MPNAPHSRAVVQLFLAALCWSLGGLLIKYLPWSPLAVVSGRGLIAALFLIALNRGVRFHWSRWQVLAAMAYAGTSLTFVMATKATTAANAILLQYTAPVWIALLGSWLLGERATRSDWITIVVVLAGMGVFVYEGVRFSSLSGNLIAVFSGFLFAVMILLMRKQKDGSPVESVILGNLLAFLIGFPALIKAPALSANGWLALVLLGTVQLGLSYWFYSQAIKHVTALEAVLIPIIEPLLNPLWVLFMTGEKPSTIALFGGAIVLGSVTARAIVSLRGTRFKRPIAAEVARSG
ncbi:MAG: DMT family transporter [Opitutaceae bacterium]|nr:DMT family transporter [Opitutaceae bacterium]